MITPTLTGLGERSDELSPDVGLSTHIEDVVRTMEERNLSDVILVGHSYAGMIISAVAVRASDRVARLVYLDAFVPTDGDRCVDLIPPEARDAIREQAQAEGDGWRFLPFPLEMLQIVADEDVQWVSPRLGPQPLMTYEEPVRLPKGNWEELPRTFIFCGERAFGGLFERFAQVARREAGWDCVELPTGHEPMVTAPVDLAKALLDLR